MTIIASHTNASGTTHRLVLTTEGGEVQYLEQYVGRDGRIQNEWECESRAWAAGRLWRIRKEARDARRQTKIQRRMSGLNV